MPPRAKPQRPKRPNGAGSVYFRKSDSRWIAALPIPGERYPRTASAHSETEGNALLAQMVKALHRDELPSRERATIAQFAADWLAKVKADATPGTYLRYEQYVKHQIVPRLGKKRLALLTAQDLDLFYAAVRTGGLSPTTVHHLHGAVHKMLAQAVAWKLIPHNPADDLDAPRKATARRPTLDAEQLARLFEAARWHRLEGIIVLAATSGLREGEIAGLRWSDIDVARGRIAVSQQMARAERGYAPRDPKSVKSRRPLRLTRIAIAALERRRIAQQAERLQAGAAWHDTGLVFTRPDGQPVAQNHLVRDVLAPLLVQAGLTYVTLHDLRHSFATLGLRSGIPLKVVSEALGHAGIGITADLYSHVSEDMQEPLVEAFDALFDAS